MFIFSPSPRIKRSPFYDSTVKEGVKSFYPYNNVFLPTGYGNPKKEYWNLINGVTMWDVGCQRQIQLLGEDSEKLAQILSPRIITDLDIGQSKYIPLCNHMGTIINDPIILKLDNNKFWFSIADSNILFWARSIAYERNMKVEIIEADASPLAVQGPKAEDIISSLMGNWIREIKHYRFKETNLEGIPIIIARSGWSKQGGFELYLMDKNKGTKLWNLVKEAGKPWNISPGYPNTTERIENGLLSWGGDTDDETNPFEVRLKKFVDLDLDNEVIGMTALKKIDKEGPKRHQLGIIIHSDEKRSSHPKWFDIIDKNEKVGSVTCGIWSWKFNKNIGFALISRDYKSGDKVEVKIEKDYVSATLTDLPFNLQEV